VAEPFALARGTLGAAFNVLSAGAAVAAGILIFWPGRIFAGSTWGFAFRKALTVVLLRCAILPKLSFLTTVYSFIGPPT
jgi:hypothetical protein